VAILASAAGAVACRGKTTPPECSDTSSLTPSERDMRSSTLGYVDRSPDATKTCSGCQQFSRVPGSACGRCAVVRGPISPQGRCKKWAAREAT
jgi:hypothetical protein